MTDSRIRRRHRLPVALLGLTLTIGLAGPAVAAPGRSSTELRAITAMKSGVSELRRGPDGKRLTKAQRAAENAEAANTLGPSEQMGAPADATVMPSHQVFSTTANNGRTVAVSAYGLNDTMTAPEAGSDRPVQLRTSLDSDHPRVAGHFLDATHESVLEFDKTQAGSDAIFQLSTTNAQAEKWTWSAAPNDITSGATVVLKPTGGSTALTNAGARQSAALGTAASVADAGPNSATPDYAQQWTINKTSISSVQLVNRADGLCLNHTATAVTTDVCSGGGAIWSFWTQAGGFGIHAGTSISDPQLSVGGGGLGLGGSQPWEFHGVSEPGGSAQSWSSVRTGGATAGNISAPYDLAAGDLDGVSTDDEQAGGATYHDEAVVAYTDSNDNWALRVVDYNARPGQLTVTAPASNLRFGKNGAFYNGHWFLGDLIVEVGDFDGDGRNEILTGYQEVNLNFDFTFWRYVANADGSRALELVSSGIGAAKPFAGTPDMTGQQGYADSAVGDFDNDGRTDLALAYATTNSDGVVQPNLGIWTLNPDLSTRSTEVITPPLDTTSGLPPAMADDPTRATSGLTLATGVFRFDPPKGYGPQHDQIALGWMASTPELTVPVINIYDVPTDDCNANSTTCTTDTTPISGQDAATPVNAPVPGTIVFPYVGPLSLAAGVYGGTAADDPPVWGLIASGTVSKSAATGVLISSITVPWTADDNSGANWTMSDKTITPFNGASVSVSNVAYDRLGLSLELGPPTTMNLEQNIKEDVVAAEPPGHVDWLNGAFSNVSASNAFNLQTSTTSTKSFSSTSTRQNSWENGARQSSDLKAKWSDGVGIGTVSGSVELKQDFAKAWSGLTQNSADTSNSWTTTTQSSTDSDDSFSYSSEDSTLYRYPVIGGPGLLTDPTSCPSGCRATYDVYVARNAMHFNNVPGKSTSVFQPSWENLNALSYPTLTGGGNVPTPDLGSYTYTDANGRTQTVTKALYNDASTVGANSGSVNLDFTSAAGSDTEQTHARTWKVGGDITASAKVTVGVPAEDGFSIKETVSAGFDVSKSTMSTDIGHSETSSDTRFQLNVPELDSGRSYRVGTAYYYSVDGAAKVVHGVDLTTTTNGKAFWLNAYGADKSDPALNLPGRIYLDYNSDTKLNDAPQWLTAPQRQLIRGFQSLQAHDDGSGLPTQGGAYTVNPQVGAGVIFQVPVHNYSLLPMTQPTTATWYAVPVDGNDLKVTGSAQQIGTSPVTAIGAQGTESVRSPAWTAPSVAANTTQQYRIFVRLDEAGTLKDIHPLSGDACPPESLEPNIDNSGAAALYDLMKPGEVADPLGCGQNNQGYGLVSVSPKASTELGATRVATAANPARAKLAGGGLVDGVADHLKLTEKSSVPTVPFGQRITGLVHASAALHSLDHPLVAVYDGPVSDGKIVGVTRMNGIDAKTGGTATFSWTPDRAGLHELHQVLLGTHATGEDDEQIMRVNVAPQLDQYAVTAKASARQVEPGAAYSISGSIAPVPNTAAERRVELQRKVGQKWEFVTAQQTSSAGRFDFDLTAGPAGTLTYRVVKTATAGRSRASSAPVTVAVGHRFSISITLSPSTVKRGKSADITGKVSPPMPSGSRAVKLQRKTGSSWKTVATKATTASGRYRFTVRPSKAGKYHYRIAKVAVGDRPTARSAPVTLTVRKR